MSINIASFIKSMLPSIGKSDIETDMEISLEYIPLVLESWAAFASISETNKLQSKEAKAIVETFYKELNSTGHKVKLKKSGQIGQDTVVLFNNAKVNGEWLLKEISDTLNDVIMSQALTAYNANLLRVVPHFYFMTKYANDLLSYIYIKEAEKAGIESDSDFGLNKKQLQFIEKNIKMYARILAVYGEKHDIFLGEMDRLSKITVAQDRIEELVVQYRSEKIDMFENLPSGFIGSPIYSIRLVFAQWEADRYRSLKDKKKLLELRHLHYKLLKEQGSSDVTVEKEITYLQKRITEIDYKVSKMEEDL